MRLARKGILFTLVVLLVLLVVAAAAFGSAPPKRVLVVVMDQMHPEYAKQYNMTNVLWLMNHGANFQNAIVGDMASETVVSHNIMVSGMLPKHMGWADEALRDTGNVLGGGANGMYVTGDLGYSDFAKLITAGGYKKLGTYLHTAYPGSIVACLGEKSYQVESMAADNADIAVRLSGTKTAEPQFSELGGKWRGPTGVNVPAYISTDNRFNINSDIQYNSYGTYYQAPAWVYPEDGNRMVPGLQTGHLGGDNWVADAAIKVMDNENWSGLFLNFGAIDKIGHMWGGGEADNLKHYNWDPNSMLDSMVHEPFIAKNADTQLGRLIGELKALGEFKDTLIVVTADHGSTAATKHFYGLNAQDAGDYNWYHGTSVNDGTDYNDPAHPVVPALQPLVDTGNLSFMYSSTAIETWLTDFSMDKKKAMAMVMRSVPGVIATYVKSDDGTSYVLDSSKTKTKMTKAEKDWWKSHAQTIVNTMAYSGSADVVGLLSDNTSYGAFGDHGGAQKDVQRIPMIFYNPGLKAATRTQEAHTDDIMPTVMRWLGITPDPAPAPQMDGTAYKLATK
jgi:hypothetical protein